MSVEQYYLAKTIIAGALVLLIVVVAWWGIKQTKRIERDFFDDREF